MGSHHFFFSASGVRCGNDDDDAGDWQIRGLDLVTVDGKCCELMTDDSMNYKFDI
jgi:hypothetical protein